MNLLTDKLMAFIIIVAVAVSLAGWKGAEKAAAVNNTPELIRFHVIANSDSPADQAMKLKVRDEVVKRMTPVLAGARDIEDARRLVDENIDIIAGISTGVLNSYGYEYTVRVERGTYGFPEKNYTVRCGDEGETADLTLPAGEYEAVRIVIGSGKGANWWCVLFPPLCFVSPEEEAGSEGPPEVPAFKYYETRPEMSEARPVFEYRFKVVEWIDQIRHEIAGNGY